MLVLHQGQYTKEEAAKIMKYGFEALHYELASPHGMISTLGRSGAALGHVDGQADGPGAAQRAVRSLGQAGGLCREKLAELPPGVNPKRIPQWGIDSWNSSPNFMLLIWGARLVDLPRSADRRHKHIFECTLYFVPPRNARERRAERVGRSDVQGVCAAGFQHPRSDPDDDRHQGRQEFSAVRSGNPAPAFSAQSDR